MLGLKRLQSFVPLGIDLVLILKPAGITAQAVTRIAALEKEVATMLQTHSDLGAALGELKIRLQDASDRLAASVARAAELECSLAACKEELESARAAAAAVGGLRLGLEERAAELQKEVISHWPQLQPMDASESLNPVCAAGGRVQEGARGARHEATERHPGTDGAGRTGAAARGDSWRSRRGDCGASSKACCS
jgi:hypothetical protein